MKRPSCHGGKHDSPPLWKFAKEAKAMFDQIQQFLLQVEGRCSDEEVVQTCANYKDLFLCIGRLFSLQRVKEPLPENHRKSIEETIVSIKQKYLTLGISTTPKAHSTFDHLLFLLDQHDGSIEAYAEDFVEQAHQTGVREEIRSSGEKRKSHKAKIHSMWEAERDMPEVIAKREEITNK